MKRILAVLLAGSLITMTACAGGKTAATTEKPQEKVQEEDTAEADSMAPSDITIAVVLKTLSSEYWNYVKAGCEAAEKDLGVRVVVVGPGAESEIAQQVAMIEEQLGQDMSAIICAPNDSSSAAAALAPAIGVIPVLFVDTDAELEGKTAFVGTGNEDAAALGGAYIAEKLGKGTRAVIIYGQEGEATSNARARGTAAHWRQPEWKFLQSSLATIPRTEPWQPWKTC